MSTAISSPQQPEIPAERARREVDRSITTFVHDVYGADGVVQVPAWPGASTTYARPRPLVGLTAAMRLRAAAANSVHDYAMTARGDGSPWVEIARALELRAEDGGEPLEMLAFEAIAGKPQSFYSWTVSWRCATCQGWVTEQSPSGEHPVDTESGHAEGCARFAADVAAYESRWED